jgi:hypothetical protein
VLWAYCLVPSVSPSVQTSVCKLEMLFRDNSPLLQHTSSGERRQNAAHSKQSSETPSDAFDSDVTRNASSREGEQGTRPEFWWHRTPLISIRGFPLSPHANGRMVPDNMPRPLPHPCYITNNHRPHASHLSPNNKYRAITRH